MLRFFPDKVFSFPFFLVARFAGDEKKLLRTKCIFMLSEYILACVNIHEPFSKSKKTITRVMLYNSLNILVIFGYY